jgi:hypothetical protein
MDYTLLNQYGIIFLIVIFICINIYYKNIINVLIFIICFLGLRNMMTEQNALFLAYIIALVYGIIKNFHLLENFKVYIGKSKNNKVNDNKLVNNNSVAANNKVANNKVANKTVANKTVANKIVANNKTITKNYNIDSALSEELINQFISKLKEVDNLLIEKSEKNIYDLKPTIKNIKKNKIERMRKNIKPSKLVKPIIISNDNFIIDGHHRWYLRKNLIETNTNGLNTNEIYNENIKVVIIDYDIKTILEKLKEFKIKYNKEYLSNSVLDISKIQKGKNLISNLKRDIGLLEDNYNTINKMKLV